MKKRCDACGGRFGLVRQRWWGYAFCSTTCKQNFLAKIAHQREKIRDWLGYLARGSAA